MGAFRKWLQSIIHPTKRNSSSAKAPNGWGRQHYSKKQKVSFKEDVDLNNITNKRGWIQAYAAKKISGLKRKKSTIAFNPYHKVRYE